MAKFEPITKDNFIPQGYKILSNSYAMEIMIGDTGESVSYRYSGDDDVSISAIYFDDTGESYFLEFSKLYSPNIQYLNEFIKA
jgi:hypothetical protein